MPVPFATSYQTYSWLEVALLQNHLWWASENSKWMLLWTWGDATVGLRRCSFLDVGLVCPRLEGTVKIGKAPAERPCSQLLLASKAIHRLGAGAMATLLQQRKAAMGLRIVPADQTVLASFLLTRRVVRIFPDNRRDCCYTSRLTAGGFHLRAASQSGSRINRCSHPAGATDAQGSFVSLLQARGGRSTALTACGLLHHCWQQELSVLLPPAQRLCIPATRLRVLCAVAFVGRTLPDLNVSETVAPSGTVSSALHHVLSLCRLPGLW